jgi:hypothetical protein
VDDGGRRGLGRRIAARAGSGSAGLSAAAGEDHRALCGWRRHRRVLAAARSADRARARPGAHHREPRRRRERHRHAGGGERRARRLHHRHGRQRVRDQSRPAQGPPALRYAQGLRPGVAALPHPTGAVRASILAVQDRTGAGRLRQGQSRQADIRIGGHRHRHPSRRRAVPPGGGDRDRDRPLSRRRARTRRLPCRQGGLHLRSRSDHPRAYPGRKGARARRDPRTRPATARHSQHGGARLRQRRFRERDGADRAGRDAGADRAEAAAHFGGGGQERRVRPQPAGTGISAIGSTTEEFRAHVDREIDKWIRVIAAGDIKPEQ